MSRPFRPCARHTAFLVCWSEPFHNGIFIEIKKISGKTGYSACGGLPPASSSSPPQGDPARRAFILQDALSYKIKKPRPVIGRGLTRFYTTCNTILMAQRHAYLFPVTQEIRQCLLASG